MGKSALVTGITGQDGAYLAQLLLKEGYRVYGAYRRSASVNYWRLRELDILDEIELVPMDLLEFPNMVRVLERTAPDEVYNLAAQSFVGLSFEQPTYTAEVNALGPARLLEAIRAVNPAIRFYQASTSEMFGKVAEIPQTERTPFYPRSPYGVAKLYAHWITVNYREAYGIHASSGILFNHESPLRGLEFVTRKITAGLARIRHGQQEDLELGNLEARRDWGFAGDFVHGIYLIVQREQPDTYVLATNRTHSAREFVERAAEATGFSLDWEGEGVQTRGIDRRTGKVLVRINPALYRPAEVDLLQGDPHKAKAELGWSPSVSFESLVEMMVRADMDRAAAGTLRF